MSNYINYINSKSTKDFFKDEEMYASFKKTDYFKNFEKDLANLDHTNAIGFELKCMGNELLETIKCLRSLSLEQHLKLMDNFKDPENKEIIESSIKDKITRMSYMMKASIEAKENDSSLMGFLKTKIGDSGLTYKEEKLMNGCSKRAYSYNYDNPLFSMVINKNGDIDALESGGMTMTRSNENGDRYSYVVKSDKLKINCFGSGDSEITSIDNQIKRSPTRKM